MSTTEQLYIPRLQWLEHVLRISVDRLRRPDLFAEPNSSSGVLSYLNVQGAIILLINKWKYIWSVLIRRSFD